jgi:bacterioferritin
MEPLNKIHLEKDRSENSVILNSLEMAINDEILAAFQYWNAYNVTAGPGKFDIDPILEEHARQEWEHVELLAQRIKELGGSFINDPTHLRAHAAPWYPVESGDVKCIAQLIYDAESQAVDKYTKLAAMTKDLDPTTHRIIVMILATEQEHKYELCKLKESLI